MVDLVEGRTLRWELNGEQTGDRCVVICYLEGVDIGAEVVAAGVARDCLRYSDGRHRDAEAQVAAAGATIRQTYVCCDTAMRAGQREIRRVVSEDGPGQTVLWRLVPMAL